MLCRLSYVRDCDTPGWDRTSVLCRRRTALLSAELRACRKSLRQESNPHLGRTKGACLPLTLRRQRGDGRSRTDIFLVASEALARLSYIPGVIRSVVRCGRVESNHHSARRRGYSAVSSPVLSVRSGRGERLQPLSWVTDPGGHAQAEPGDRLKPGTGSRGRPVGLEPTLRGSRPRVLPLHHGHRETRPRSGDDRARTGAFSPDKRALCPSELRPRVAVARVGFEPTVSSS